MARTSAVAVGGIIQVNPAIDLAPFIETATVLVDDVEANSDHDAARLELIERYLAAHIYCIRDPRVQTEQGGSVSVVYQSKVDQSLASSHYGQMAMVLDTSGTLSSFHRNAFAKSFEPVRGTTTAAGSTFTAGISWLGSEE